MIARDYTADTVIEQNHDPVKHLYAHTKKEKMEANKGHVNNNCDRRDKTGGQIRNEAK